MFKSTKPPVVQRIGPIFHDERGLRIGRPFVVATTESGAYYRAQTYEGLVTMLHNRSNKSKILKIKAVNH